MNQYLRRKIWTLNRSGKFRGYLRTVSGYPVTLTDCMVGQPVSMAVDGNAVQDGTPSPDAPVEVQLCGDNALSEGYTAVEYIESTGEQWIDTNFQIDQDSGMYLDAQLTEVPEDFTDNTALIFCGCVNNNFGIGISSTNHTFAFMRKRGVGATNNGSTGHSPDTDRHIFKNNFFNDHYFVLDSEFLNAPDANFSNDYGIAIFRSTYGSNTVYYHTPIKARIYRLKLSQGNEIIADLCPAKRDIDGAIGMYDIIQDVFYTNSGTGEFIAGNGICAAYKVSGRAEGLNLLSNNENDWVSNAGTYKYFTIPVEGTTTLQVKIKEGKSIPEDLYLGYTKNGINTTGGLVWLIRNGIINIPTYTSELKCISIFPRMALDKIFDSLDIMLIEGAYTAETIPAYEPYREPQTFNIYTPQQLAKVGDTADTVVLDFDSNTAKLVNAVGIDDLSALSLNAAWNDVCIFDCKQPQYRMIQGSSGICNRFVCRGGWENTEKVAITNTYFRLFIAKTRIGYTEEDTSDTLVQKANDWLSENETYGLYSIATPITTDITALQDWDAMPSLWSGTAEITADTVIAPSAITAKYYASKPEEVN